MAVDSTSPLTDEVLAQYLQELANSGENVLGRGRPVADAVAAHTLANGTAIRGVLRVLASLEADVAALREGKTS